MPLVQEMRHTRSLNFRNERRVIILRGIGLSFPRIAGKVWNREGNHPPVRTVADVYYNFSKNMDRRKYKYKKCGRKPWKLTKDVQAFLVRRLLLLRKTRPCTSTMLQQALAAEKGIHVAATAIRKCLRKHGYKWLPRCQKRKYSREDRKKRRQFARQRKKRQGKQKADVRRVVWFRITDSVHDLRVLTTTSSGTQKRSVLTPIPSGAQKRR